jgi:two-component system response regulator TctD
MRLLIVEDDLILQDGLKRTFTQSGYEVDIIADGELADSIMRNQSYDVIVLDFALPKLDGFEVLKRFRARGN